MRNSRSAGESPTGQSQEELISLLMRNRHRIFGYIFTLVPNRADAEDIFQEVSAVIWKKIDTFEEGSDFVAWANRIAYWEVRAARKRFARSKVIFDDTLFESVCETAADLGEEVHDRRLALETCLGKLGNRDREFILRRYSSSSGGVEAAAETSGRSIQAAYKALTRLRRSLYNCVSKEVARTA